MFSIIAAIGKNRELGKGGDLVFHIREDMKFFKNTTMGHTVVMGRRTWESLPKKLPGRKNVVVTRSGIDGADETVTDLPKYIQENKNTEEEIFVIGGAMLYDEFLPYAKNLYLTEVNASAEADVFFPSFDKNQYKKISLGNGNDEGIKYEFVKYERIEGES
ncbi:dihydrofolate reductase [Candidatus Saccharibacteria bacterium]|nr:dihydrofolate reductase [Candidatus Saccharibacteria bacterium]